MKITFLQNGGVAQFGIMSLSAVLKEQNHKCDVFIGGTEKDLLKAAAKSKPDAIAFPCRLQSISGSPKQSQK